MDKDKLVKEIEEGLYKCKSVFANSHHYTLKEQEKMIRKDAEALVNKGLVFKSSVEVDEDKISQIIVFWNEALIKRGFNEGYGIDAEGYEDLFDALSTTDIIK